VAVYSRSAKSAHSVLEGASHSAEVYSNDSPKGKQLEDLLARKDLDVVIVALPINVQPEVIKQALLAGKHVLSEKPIAKDVKTAEELIKFYRNLGSGAPHWGVAENFRYMVAYDKANAVTASYGKVTNFQLNFYGRVNVGDKYFETPWRKVPDYQGGFLLDGGVHFVASLRKLLGQPIDKIVSFSKLTLDYLPPIDTVNGVGVLKDGTSGTLSMTFAASKGGLEATVQFEKGYVTASPGSFTYKALDEKTATTVEVKDNDGEKAVHKEVDAFIKGVVAKKADPKQIPEEAFEDLALVEALCQSNGTLYKVAHI
jgi:predicted dehydrogenase